MSEIFSPHRLGLLIRNDAIADYRSLLIISATLAGIILILAMLSRGSSSENDYFYLLLYIGILLTWGPISSSRSFKELHDKTANEAYLLLPASTLEKMIARLLSVTVIFMGYLLVFMSLTSAVIESLNSLLFGKNNQWFHPLDVMEWSLFGHYLVIQSLYFLGAAWFRKTHFIKTTLAITIACIGLAVLTLVIVRFVLVPSFDDLELSIDSLYALYNGVIDVAEISLMTLYFVGLPVLCWSVAWLRVRETQVSDGV